jgi:hypothetical protein
VVIEGQIAKYEALVDRFGHFKIAGLPPGPYAVSVDAIGSGEKMQRVVVADKGCAETDFKLEPPPVIKRPQRFWDRSVSQCGPNRLLRPKASFR